MRTLTVNTQNKTVQRLASEPILILQIDWSNGTQYYGDKSFVLSGNNVQGKLLEFSPIEASGKQDTGGEVSTASVTIDDVDGTLKVIVNTLIVPGTLATVYHHYEGNAWTDKTLVFKGKLNGTIVWEEGERQLSFDIESYIDDAEVGYAPEEGDLANQNPDTYGVMWPIVFGAVKKIKAVPVIKGALGNNTDGIIGGWPAYDAFPFEVEGGDKYPQNTPIDIVVDATRFHGFFQGNIFHRDISNLIWYTGVTVEARDGADADAGNPQVCWVQNGVNLNKKQCWLGVGKQFNYCERQEGNKCYFKFVWDHLLANETFEEVRGCVANYWYVAPTFLNYWYIKPRCLVYQYNKGYSDIYVVSEYPSTEVVEVFAWRTYGEQEIFVPVPSSYYTIHLSYAIGTRNVTAIEFTKPLSQYENEKWKDDIYVSVRSTLPNNTSDVIKWLIQTYTSYGVDTASFDAAKLDLAAYPSNFALFTKQNVIALIEEIAWQARCAIFVHNGVISIKYLSKDMPSNYNLSKTDVLLKTLQLSFTTIEDIYTKMTSTWKLDYSDRDEMQKKIVYSNNINQFGLRTLEKEIYIYNIEELAKMTAYFWGYRYSNSWRIAEYPTLLRTLALELFDCVAHNISTISSFIIRGMIEDISHDSVANEISIKAQLASRAGQHSGGQPVEDPYFWIGDPAYVVTPRAITDPLSGLTIVDYVVPVVDENNNTSGTGGGTGTELSYEYRFILPTQDEIERGTNFPVKIQLFNNLDQRVSTAATARLSIHSEDSGDRLTTGVTEKLINLVNGEYSVTNEQITGGTTDQYSAFLSCVDDLQRDDYATGNSELFSIIDTKTGVLTWATNPPANVQRGVSFAIQITGGVAGQIIDVQYNGTDVLDKVYSGGSMITEITLGGGEVYNGTWSVLGGSGTEAANKFTLMDSRYATYANSDSTNFTINAAGQSIVQSLVQNLVVADEVRYTKTNDPGDLLHVALTLISGEIGDNMLFRMKTALADGDGNPVNYTGPVTLFIVDDDINEMNWLEPGTGPVLIRNMVNGLLEEDYKLRIEAFNVSPLYIGATVIYNGISYTGELEASFIGLQSLVQSFGTSQYLEKKETTLTVTGPLSFVRGVAFNITVQAMNGEAPDTTYVPAADLTITLTGPLNGEAPTPAVITPAGWSNGAKTQSVTINGGSGAKVLTITVED